MASTKRDRSALSTPDDVSARQTKRLKYTHSSQHPFGRRVPHAADASAEKHHPGGSRFENEKEKGTKPHPPINKQRPAYRAMTDVEKRAKQQHLDDQVSFIILTRDNLKPDPYSTVSTTYAPKSWTTVAKAYNEKYGVSVTPAAMEKRVRQHRAAWIANHPGYPTKITYAKKNDVHPTPGAGTSARKTEDRDILRVLDHDASYERSAGWTPPDELRNASDLRDYIKHATLADSSAVTIEILDAEEALLGTATIDRQLFQRNSHVFSILDDDEATVHVQLHGPLEKILQCYALSTSSTALPQSSNDETNDDVSLINLYCLAAQLDDDHVRGLVMDRWCLLSAQNKDVEFVLADLNLLFECTRCSDPARDVWARSVCAAGLAETLLTMDECGSALANRLQRLEAEENVGHMGDEQHRG